jgi:hypothetical protein
VNRDTLERLFWTVLATGLGTLVVYLSDQPYGWVPVATAVVNWVLIFVRSKVSALPDPGAGLPGLPT